jgi:hypothetical protein
MPRIRSIKPEHWGDKYLPKISIGAHLLWIGMWNFSDDKGIIEKDYQLIKANVFPRRKEIKPIHVEKWVKELIKYEFVIPLEHKGIQYLIHRTFDVHQKIDRPQKSKISDELIRRTLDEYSTNSNRTLDDDSGTIRRKDRIGEDRIGKDIENGYFNSNYQNENKENLLCPKMLKILKKQIPDYVEDISRDYQPLYSIGQFIFNHSKIEGSILDNTEKVCSEWNSICIWLKDDSFYSQKSLKTISTHIQEIVNKSKNGSSKSEKPLTEYEKKVISDREKAKKYNYE